MKVAERGRGAVSHCRCRSSSARATGGGALSTVVDTQLRCYQLATGERRRMSSVVSGVSLIERIDSRRSFHGPRRTAPDHGDDHTRHAMSEGVGEEYPRRGGQRTDP